MKNLCSRTQIILEAKDRGPKIMKQKLGYALKNMKAENSTILNQIRVETFKLIDGNLLYVLLNMFKMVYDTGIITRQ